MALEPIGLKAVMEMSDFERGVKVYNSSIDEMVGAGEDLSASAKTQLTSLTNLAQVLSDASPAKLATTALSQLEQRFVDGSITASQYASAVTQVQDEFGLVTPSGKAAAGTLTELNAKFQAGEISAEEYADGLKKIDVAQEATGQSAVDMAAQMELVSGAIDAVMGAIGEAVELADLAVQSERAEKRFRAFAGEIGDADELIAAFNRGAGNTVDKMTAMTSAGRLLQMGLVQSNDEMEQVVEIATRLGDQTQTAGDRVADFALLLANQSIPRLDNFGISSGKVRDRIKELQAAFPEMSREAAFSQAVFEQGAKSLDILGARTKDAGTDMEVARAKLADMRVEIGQKLLPVISKLFGFIASLNTDTLAMIAVLGGGVPVVIKLGMAFKALAAGMKTGSVGAGGMALRMGVLAAALVALVVVADSFNNKMDEMNAAQASAEEAGASMGDQFTALVEGGASVGDALAQMQEQIDAATQSFDDNAVTGSVLGEIFGANAAFADTLAESYGSINESLADGAPSYAAYVEEAKAFNLANSEAPEKLEKLNAELAQIEVNAQAGISGLAATARATEEVQAEINILTQELEAGAGALDVMTETQFRMAEIMRDGASAASLQADAILQARFAIDDTTTAVDRAFPILGRYNENQERGASKADAMGDAVESSSQQIQASSGVIEANAAALAVRTAAAEKVARVEDMQAASALAAAAALEAKRVKDTEVVQAEQALAQSVLNASDAMIAQTFITGLDPEAMGLTAYRAAVEDIQLAFGLATPESIALARGINEGIDEINAGNIAYDEMSGFINAVIDDSKDAKSNMGSLTGEFASQAAESENLATRIEETGDAMGGIIARGDELIAVEEGLTTGTKEYKDQVQDTGDVIANVADDTELWTDSITSNKKAIDGSQVTAEQWAEKMQNLDKTLIATGEDLLSVDDKVAAMNASLERTDGAADGAASGLVVVEETSAAAALAIDEATASTAELDAALAATAAGAPAHGAAIGSGISDGLNASLRPMIDSFKGQLQELRNALPGSEPKDTTSPLYGLSDSGIAIVENIADGINSGAGSAIDAIMNVGAGIQKAFASSVGSLGGTASGIFTRETVKPLQERVKGMSADMSASAKAQEKFSKEIAKLQESRQKAIESEDLEKQLKIEKELLAIEAERDALTGRMLISSKKLTASRAELEKQEARVERFRGAQERLKLLEQQSNLLELITEKGLDAGIVLGDMTLGVDASAGEILDAMARATELLVVQAEKRLSLGDQPAAGDQPADAGQETARERLKFLRDQLSLLDSLTSMGLDTGIVLDKQLLGLFASANNLSFAASAVTDASIRQAEEQLAAALDMAAAADQSAEDIFAAIGELERGGGEAGELLISRIINPLKDTIVELTGGISEARTESRGLAIENEKIFQSLEKQGGFEELFLQRAIDRTQLTAEQNALMDKFIANQERRGVLSQRIAGLEGNIAATTEELVAQQERLVKLQEQQERLAFLEQQAKLLDLIAEKGLDANAILGGMTLGVDASVDDLIAAMSAAMEAIIAQAQEDLGIASPSKVFEKIGGETMAGMAMGIEKLMGLPVAQSAIATQAMVATPAAIMAGGSSTSIDNSRNVDVNIGGQGGGGQRSEMQLAALVRRIMREEIRR